MNTNTLTTRAGRTLAIAGAALSIAAGLAACRGERSEDNPRQFLPDMDDSPKFKPQTETEFFADGRSMRAPVKGTIAFGPSHHADSLWRRLEAERPAEVASGIDPAGKPDKEGNPAYVQFIPAAAVDEFIAVEADRTGQPAIEKRDEAFRAQITRGQERFNIYCSVCHGYLGDGKGAVGLRWGYPVPSLHDPKYADRAQKTGKDGYIFHTIREGVPDTDPAKPTKMPSYRDKISESDAWAIVAYVRVLQATWKDGGPQKTTSTGNEAGPASAAAPSISAEVTR